MATSLHQDGREQRVRFAEPFVELDRALEVVDRGIGIPRPCVGESKLIVHLRMPWIGRQDDGEVFDDASPVAGREQHRGAIEAVLGAAAKRLDLAPDRIGCRP